MILDEKMKFSLAGGGVAIVSILTLSVLKPSFVTVIQPDGNKKINWGKLISLSVVLGILVNIVLYLVKTPIVKTEIEPVKMGFKKISDCY